MEKSKIVATLGPSCNKSNIIEKMALAGVDVFRINMSHSNHFLNQILIDEFNAVRKKLDSPLSLMIDTKGPEIRLGKFKNGGTFLNKNSLFTITKKDIIGDETISSVTYKPLIDKIKINQKIFANNGMLVLKVISKTQDDLVCKVIYGGPLTDNKGLNVPTLQIDSNFISEADKLDIKFAIKNKADYIAASFVSSKEDIFEMRQFLDENGGKNISIISKIENQNAIKNIDEIIENSDGIMFARGDLGVEIPLYKLPPLQKKIIKLCNKKAKISIVATEMLESMTTSLRPTRAEVSDVANAVYDLTSATMLSGETAIGKNPILTCKTMAKVIKEAENNIDYKKEFLSTKCSTTFKNAIKEKVKFIVCNNLNLDKIKSISSLRCGLPILCMCKDEKQKNKLSLIWSVRSFVVNKNSSLNEIKDFILSNNLAHKNNKILFINEKTQEIITL